MKQVNQSTRNKLPGSQALNSMTFLGAQGSEACQESLVKEKDTRLQVTPPATWKEVQCRTVLQAWEVADTES